VLLGRWTKRASLYGREQDVDVLALAAGGHYEAMGDRLGGMEPGDMSLRAAADKELKEEVGIDRRQVRATTYLGVYDDVLREVRRSAMHRSAGLTPA
jgi:predicted NUDIX family phosphoesterase